MAMPPRARGWVFPIVVILTFGFAVGANVSVVSLISALWLEPRAVRSPDTIAVLYSAVGASTAGEVTDAITYATATSLRSLPEIGVSF
jgi:hypothetical protein